jgi:putative hydrolase of the HAD superfamily
VIATELVGSHLGLLSWKPMRKAALFDAGDTLLHWNVHRRDRFVWLCEQVGITLPYDQIARTSAARAADRFFYSQRGRDDSWTEAWWTQQIAVGLAELGLSPELAIQIQAHRAALPSTWWLDPDAIPVFKELRQRGYKIGLVSNWDGTLATTCSELGLAPYVDYIGDSTVFGQVKPAPAFFLHVLDKLGARPEAAFHAGDDYDADVEGARAAGITPIFMDIFGHEQRVCEYRATGLRDVLTLSDLLIPKT